jgi:hypothetical protein
MAMASAMSFRQPEPSVLATNLQQMIRAAGRPSAALQAYAGGRQLGATEIMQFQSGYISKAMEAGGPQGAMAAAEELGVAPEVATVYAGVFDPAVQARMRGLQAAGGAATWAGLAGRYGAVRGRPEARYQAATYGARLERMRRAVGEEQYHAAYEAQRERVQEYFRTGGRWARVREAIQGEDAVTRQMLLEGTRARLEAIAAGGGEMGRQALRHHALLGATPGAWLGPGGGIRGDLAEAIDWLQTVQPGGNVIVEGDVHYGGTSYINKDRRDPAGRPHPPAIPQ